MTTKLTAAERRVLNVLRRHPREWVDKSHESYDGDAWPRVHSRTVHRLVVRGFAKEACVLPGGRVIDGEDLAHFFGHWKRAYKITAAGRAALRGAA